MFANALSAANLDAGVSVFALGSSLALTSPNNLWVSMISLTLLVLFDTQVFKASLTISVSEA